MTRDSDKKYGFSPVGILYTLFLRSYTPTLTFNTAALGITLDFIASETYYRPSLIVESFGYDVVY